MKKFVRLLFVFVLFVGFQCLNAVDSKVDSKKDSKKIRLEVGTGNSYRPFAYIDNNELKGYDVDVLRLINKYDSNLDINFNPVPWNAIFVGLDSKKFNILAYEITKTKEREEKYIFSTYPYFNDISAVIVRENQQITDIKELNNKKIGVSLGSNYALNLEKYLKSRPDLKIEIKYYKNPPTLISDLGTNRIQAVIGEPISSINIAKAQNIKLKATDIIIDKTPVFFVFNKNDTALCERVSNALKAAIESGELSKLSIQYFGQDLSK